MDETRSSERIDFKQLFSEINNKTDKKVIEKRGVLRTKLSYLKNDQVVLAYQYLKNSKIMNKLEESKLKMVFRSSF